MCLKLQIKVAKNNHLIITFHMEKYLGCFSAMIETFQLFANFLTDILSES